MIDQYMTEGERQRRAAAEAAEKGNVTLVGELKTYKGVSYQMQQRGSYTCVDLPPNSGLEGLFTTAFALHKFIDDLQKSKGKK